MSIKKRYNARLHFMERANCSDPGNIQAGRIGLNVNVFAAVILVFMIFFNPSAWAGKPDPFTAPSHGFTSWLPAREWENALLTGNGIIGAMVMGHPFNETIILNHALLFMPVTPPLKPIDLASRLMEIRQLDFQDKFAEAGKIPVEIAAKEGYGGLRWTDPYIPAFDLSVMMPAHNVKRYIRKVNFENAETSVCWKDTDGIFQKRLFVSRADNVVVMSITGTGRINCTIGFRRHPADWQQWSFVNSNIGETSVTARDSFLIYRSQFKKHWKGSLQGYEGIGKVIPRGGTMSVSGNRIIVKNAKEVLILVRIKPSLNYSVSGVAAMKMALNSLVPDYNRLLARHAKIHSALFNRVSLNLYGNKNHARRDAEIANLAARDHESNALIEKQFEAARYNIICATGIRPPNLQGIWNGSWTPPWSSDYTQDGNLEVAVSSMLCGNMPELLLPLFNYEDQLIPYFKDNAKYLYGCRGIQVPSRSSTHGWNDHFSEGWPLTFWNAGAGWISEYYFDYWQYTHDSTFLRKKAFPFMKEAALFYEDFLTLGKNGKYVFNPSYSPENTPLGHKSQTCINATMDVAVARQLLLHCLEAGKILHENIDTMNIWENMLSKMPEYQLNKDSALREWLWPGLEDQYAHRHVSHLYGIFYEIDPEIAHNPTLIAGCKKAIGERMKIREQENGGEMVFGLVNLAWAAENMGERKMTGEIINWLSSRYWTNGMGTCHNPGNLFNMDLSGGFPSVIINALVHAESGYIDLLPALPGYWPKGSLSGVLLRGHVTLENLSWSDMGKHISFVVFSHEHESLQLKFPGKVKNIRVDGKIQPLTHRHNIVLSAERKTHVIVDLVDLND